MLIKYNNEKLVNKKIIQKLTMQKQRCKDIYSYANMRKINQKE